MSVPEPGPEERREIAGRIQGGAATAGKIVGLMIALAFFIYLLRTVLLPFVIAGILGYIGNFFIAWVGKRVPAPRWVLALVMLLLLIGLGALVGWLGVPPLLQEIKSITNNLHDVIQGFVGKLMGNGKITAFGGSVTASEIADYIVKALKTWINQNGRLLQLGALGFAGAFGIILTLVILGYFLFDGPRVSRGLFWLVPPSYRPFAGRAWKELDPVLRRYFIGVALVVIYASVAAYIGLSLLGLQHAIVLAILTGFLEVLPVIGPVASATIAGLVAVQEAKGASGIIAYIVYAVALRISIDEFFAPIVLSKAGYIPAVVVIFCFLAGGLLFGIIGIILAVPVALTVRVILHVLYDELPQPEGKDG